MQKNLVIVESPAKAKTIEKFLGSDYKVMSSYGHIRDLKKKEMSIDTGTLEPEYEIPEEKEKLVKELKNNAEKAEKVWLASDEDREEKPSRGTCVRCWDWTRRKPTVSYSTKSPSRLFCKPSRPHVTWI